MRFYLDEDQSDDIAAIARAQLGLAVASSHELGMDHATDAEQLTFAAEDRRCIVTRNAKDFVPLTRRLEQQQLPHGGVLIVPKSMLGEDYWTIARALAYYHHLHPEDTIPYLVDYLHPAPADWEP